MLDQGVQQLNLRFSQQIPIARQMGLRITAWGAGHLRMDAPLAPNINDKGTGFAGSLATIVTFSCWAVATLLAEKLADRDWEAVVFESEIRYLAPVTADFYAMVSVPAYEVTQVFLTELEQRGRAILALSATVFQDGKEKVRYRGRYAVRARRG